MPTIAGKDEIASMVKMVAPGWFEVSHPKFGRAWFRSMTECALWLIRQRGLIVKHRRTA